MSSNRPPDDSERRRLISSYFQSLQDNNKTHNLPDTPSSIGNNQFAPSSFDQKEISELFKDFVGIDKDQSFPDLPPTAIKEDEDFFRRERLQAKQEKFRAISMRFVLLLTFLALVLGGVGYWYQYTYVKQPLSLSQDDTDNICNSANLPTQQEDINLILSYKGIVQAKIPNYVDPSKNEPITDPPYQKVLDVNNLAGTYKLTACTMWVTAHIQTKKGKLYRIFELEYDINGYSLDGRNYITGDWSIIPDDAYYLTS